MHMRIRRQQVVNLQQVTASQDPAAQLAQCRTAFPKQEHVHVVGAPQPEFTPPSNSPSANQTNPIPHTTGITATSAIHLSHSRLESFTRAIKSRLPSFSGCRRRSSRRCARYSAQRPRLRSPANLHPPLRNRRPQPQAQERRHAAGAEAARCCAPEVPGHHEAPTGRTQRHGRGPSPSSSRSR